MRGWAALVTSCAFVCALFGAGCAIMPTNGPASYDIRSEVPKEAESLPYALVKLTPAVTTILAQNSPRLANTFANRRPPKEIRFGIGDIVGVTIFEAGAGGLFIPAEAGVRPGNFIALPNQAVDSHGGISVPYAGAIRARDRTPTEVQQAIVDAIKNRAIDPQVIVTLVDQRSSQISVLGEVNAPRRFPANAEGEHILDAITRAGGPKSQGFDTWVLLERQGRREIVPFGSLVYEPANNIYVHANDTIYLYRQPQTFVAFGASGQQGQFSFDAWRISLAEAVGRTGGLNDASADPASIFIYRGETREVAEKSGVDITKFSGPIIPIIYNVNFRDPAGYFVATQFQMRNKDVLYTSNAVTVETSKFLTYVRLILATVNDPISYANNAYALKSAINGTSSSSVTSIIIPHP